MSSGEYFSSLQLNIPSFLIKAKIYISAVLSAASIHFWKSSFVNVKPNSASQIFFFSAIVSAAVIVPLFLETYAINSPLLFLTTTAFSIFLYFLKAFSISPNSTLYPLTLTWVSFRPTNSIIPSSLYSPKSPVLYMRSLI